MPISDNGGVDSRIEHEAQSPTGSIQPGPGAVQPPPVKPRRRRRWPYVLATIVVLLGVGIALFDFNWLRPIVEAKASAALGRKVTIGHFDVQLARNPLIVLDDISIANPAGFPADSKTAEVTRLAVRIDPWAYLHDGTISLPEVTVDKPRADLKLDPKGEPNWQFGNTDTASTTPPSNKPEATKPPQIGSLVINEGNVHFDDPKLKANLNTAIYTTTDQQSGKPQIVVQGKGTYAGAASVIDVRAGSLLDLTQANIRYPVNLHWDVAQTHISLNGTVDNPTNFAGLAGKLDLQGPDLADLYPIAGVVLPHSPPYHLNGNIGYADKIVKFTDFKGTMGSSDLNGAIGVDISGKKPKLDGNLISNKIVLADLAGFIGAPPGKENAPRTTEEKREEAQQNASGKVLPTSTFNFEKLNAMNAHVIYKGEHLQQTYLPLDNIQADLTLQDGKLTLKPLNFGVGVGSVALTVGIDASRAPAKVDLDAEFKRIDLKRIMQETKIFEGLGMMGGRAQLHSSGNSVSDLMSRGDGGLTLVMGSGQMSTLLAKYADLYLGEAVGLLTGITGPKNEMHAIRCMVLDTNLQKGVLTTKTFVLDTTETIITGEGGLNFATEAMNFKIHPEGKNVTIGSFRTPIDIAGTLKNPSVYPDPVVTGTRVAAMVGLGVLLTPLGALIPTIDLGMGEDANCRALITQAQGSAARSGPARTNLVRQPSTGRAAIPNATTR